jgi:DNA-binding response OmpR family regulator
MSARILVVEDDRSTLTMLIEMLSGWGYQTAGATSGDRALAEMARECPDVVISDLLMPGMSGIDLLHAIRAQKDCQVAFFLITGQPSVSIGVKAIADGADECLMKPFEPETLLDCLERRGFYGHA